MTREANGDPYSIDRARMRRGFRVAASGYDTAAVLAARVGETLLERLEWVEMTPEWVLDAGAGTGKGTIGLTQRYPAAKVLALDSSAAMLGRYHGQADGDDATLPGSATRHAVIADAANLPLGDGRFDMVYSSLMLPWCTDVDAVFREFRRILRPRGLLTFATYGPDTLCELRAAWADVDNGIHVHRFIDMHDLGDALVRAGLTEPVLDVERFTLTYSDAAALARDLRAVGATNSTSGRRRGLTTPRSLGSMFEAYEKFRIDGRVPATYEVVFGQAWAPLPGTTESDGNVRIPIDSIGRRSR